MRASVFLLMGLALALAQSRSPVTDEEVRRVHSSSLLIDTHNDVPTDTVKGADIGSRKGHTDIDRLRRGGVGAVFFSAYVSRAYVEGNRSANRALEMIDTIRHDIVARYPEVFSLALTAGDIEAARARGRIAALIGIEGGHAIEDSLRLLRDYYALGVRYMTLTHNNHNNWADAAASPGAPNNGLSGFGRQVVGEMNRLGMMIDVSHVSDKTFYDALDASKSPVLATHSSCRGLTSIARNMTDEMIAALARNGGVIQIAFGCEFISQASADASTWANPRLAAEIRAQVDREVSDPKQRAELAAKRLAEQDARVPRAAIADLVAHISHAVKIGGIDAVGIGSDYDGVECVPVGLEDVSQFPNLTRALLEAGYTADQIRKIYGGNLLRVMRENERIAGQLQAN